MTSASKLPDEALERIRAYLLAQSAPDLRKLLFAEAQADDGLRARLLRRAAAHASDPATLKRLRAAINRATDEPDFEEHDYPSASPAGLDRAVAGIEALARANPEDAIPLAEHAMRRTEHLMAHSDDPEGELHGVLERLQEAHLEACRAARPEPVALARRLFGGETRSQFECFYDAAATYADVLGEAGLAEYRRLAQEAWAQVPALGPGERGRETSHRYAITRVMETLARRSGDLDALVAVLSRDLSSAHRFLMVATACRDAGAYDAAMDWVRRGMSLPGHPDSRLQLFLADEHHRRGEHAQAVALVWDVFASRPALEGYRLLHDHAGRDGSWPAWRERALERLRAETAGRVAREARYAAVGRHGHAELVRVFLWEGDVEAAWSEARAGGCTPELWLELARKREADHPADSLQIYRQLVDAELTVTGDRAYQAAVRLLPHIRDTMAGVGEDFPAYLAALRATYKRRPKLVEMLDTFARREASRPKPKGG